MLRNFVFVILALVLVIFAIRAFTAHQTTVQPSGSHAKAGNRSAKNPKPFAYNDHFYRQVGKAWVVDGNPRCSGRDRLAIRKQNESVVGEQLYPDFCYLPQEQEQAAAYWVYGSAMPRCTRFGYVPHIEGDGSINLRIYWDKTKEGCGNPDQCHKNLYAEDARYSSLIQDYDEELALRNRKGCPADLIESDEEFRTGIHPEDNAKNDESSESIAQLPEGKKEVPKLRSLRTEAEFSELLQITMGGPFSKYNLTEDQIKALAFNIYERCLREGVTSNDELATCAFGPK